ncbi:hypothetical protein FACS1894113_5310 [Alphaproteobacteria bacterium]|nr:hypothetical protein FACS1894113_5310 [Alphaproteobacteria bacterium]
MVSYRPVALNTILYAFAEIMIFKLIIYIILLTIGWFGYVYFGSDNHSDYCDSKKSIIKELSSRINSGKNISYSVNIKGGRLDIEAKKVSFGKSLDAFIFEDMAATFFSKNKNIKISAKKCLLYPKAKKADFMKEVILRGKDFFLKTDAAKLDLTAKTLSGNSKITGQSSGIEISAKGFNINENGKITLKQVEMSKRRKEILNTF